MSKKNTLLKATLVSLGLFLASLANATVVTFDDLPHWTNVGNDYHGLNWTNVYSYDASQSNSGYGNANVSGQNTTFNPHAQDATVSGDLFDFNGVYLTAAWNNSLNIKVTGSKNGQELYSQTVIVDTYSPSWFDFNFFGIDTLTFDSFGGTPNPDYISFGSGEHFAMDNFTFNSIQTAVTESSSFILVGLGLLSLFGSRRLKK